MTAAVNVGVADEGRRAVGAAVAAVQVGAGGVRVAAAVAHNFALVDLEANRAAGAEVTRRAPAALHELGAVEVGGVGAGGVRVAAAVGRLEAALDRLGLAAHQIAHLAVDAVRLAPGDAPASLARHIAGLAAGGFGELTRPEGRVRGGLGLAA